MTTAKHHSIQPHWISKTLAGGLLGATLALALAGLFAWWGPGGINAPDKVQLTMWITAPIWLCVFSASYLFRTGYRAWCWLLLANALAYAALYLARQTGSV